MKRKTLILVLCLCIAALSMFYVAAADLSQEYVSEDGTFTFRYPETYVLGGDMETGINLTADWGIALIYKTGYEALGLPEDSYDPASLLATLEASAPERHFTDKIALEIEGYDAVRANVVEADEASLLIILELNPQEAVIVFASASPSQYETMEADMVATAETIKAYSATPANLVVDSNVPSNRPETTTIAANCSLPLPIDGFAC